ncbi:MAG: hypothetical protein Q4G25_05615 [Paracoccus sp. (in: a-proteobacteria)]|nr:hypothetical protein [Paracoccus sp. (in: a-proteobacteria)]
MIRAALCLLALAAPAAARSVGPCGDWTRAEALAEPWEQFSATYASGALRLAVLDSAEPAAAAVHLLILSPPYDEANDRQCRVVSLNEAQADGWPIGFFDMDFAARVADYDPVSGLVVTIPAQTFVPETGGGAPAALTVTIDQQSGAISAELAPG